ncbi:FecR domain-containing protein [Variovorax sp. LARHSF232]
MSVFAIALLVGTGAIAQSTATITPPTRASTAAFEGHAGFIKSVEGKVNVVNAAGVTRPVKAGDPVAPADRVETDKDSGASVVLRDGTMIVVGPSSRLDLKAFRFDSTTQDGGVFIALLRGSMRMITGLIGKKNPDAIRVDTQTATIGIRGTDFIVKADDKV